MRKLLQITDAVGDIDSGNFPAWLVRILPFWHLDSASADSQWQTQPPGTPKRRRSPGRNPFTFNRIDHWDASLTIRWPGSHSARHHTEHWR